MLVDIYLQIKFSMDDPHHVPNWANNTTPPENSTVNE